MTRYRLMSVVVAVVLSVSLAVAQERLSDLPAEGVEGVAQLSFPALMRFSGKLSKAAGKIQPNVIGATFSLYAEQEGGSPLWLETHNVFPDAAGNYAVLLGANSRDGLPVDLFASTEARWLGVQVAGQAEQPRILLVSVPYALKAAEAERLAGRPASDYLVADQWREQVKRAVDLQAQQAVLSTAPDADKSAITEAGRSTFTDNNATEVVFVEQTGTGFGLKAFAPSSPALYGESASSVGIFGKSTASVGGAVGVRGENAGTVGRGVFGVASAATGFTFGVQGTSFSTSGTGVFGENLSSGGGQGLFGRVSSPSGIGVRGEATATSGNNIGIWGKTFSSTGRAALLEVTNTSATLLSGVAGGVSKFTVDGQGNVTAAGTFTGSSLMFSDGSSLTSATTVGDITAVTAGTGLTGGATAGNATLALSLAALTRGITYIAGCDTCSALADTDDQQTIYQNVVGAAMTITQVTCFANFTDGSTPTINLKRDDGSPADILSSNLVCSTTGTSTTTFAAGEDVLNLNDKLDFHLVSAGGNAKRVTVVIKTILN